VRHWIDRSGARKLAIAAGSSRMSGSIGGWRKICRLDESLSFPQWRRRLASAPAWGFLLERDGLPMWLAQRRRLDNVYLGHDYDEAIDRCLGAANGIDRIPVIPNSGNRIDCAGKPGRSTPGRMEYGPAPSARAASWPVRRMPAS